MFDVDLYAWKIGDFYMTAEYDTQLQIALTRHQLREFSFHIHLKMDGETESDEKNSTKK